MPVIALQQPAPIIVGVVEQRVESTSVADILIGSLGLTGVLLLAALVLGAVLGGVLIGLKLVRARYDLERPSTVDELRVTPGRTT